MGEKDTRILKWFMRNEAGDFKTWVIENKLDKILKTKQR